MMVTTARHLKSDPLANAIAMIGDDDDLRAVLLEMRQLTGMKFAAIAFVSEERWIASQIDDGLEFGLAPGDELDVQMTICKQVRAGAYEILIDDVARDPDWSSHAVPRKYGFRSYLSIPILVGSAFFGTLCAIDPNPRVQPLADIRDKLLVMAGKTGHLLMERMRQDLSAHSTSHLSN
jgi:GAF domain-containing protein